MPTEWERRRNWYRNNYLNSRYWKWARKIIARRAGYRCEVRGCDRTGRNLNAHHTTYSVIFLEWLVPFTMVYLCPVHHSDTHSGKPLRLRRWFGLYLLAPYE